MSGMRYARVTQIDDACNLKSEAGAMFIAGGTNMVDLMAQGVYRPELLIDIRRIGHDQIVVREDGSVGLGALVTNSDAAFHPHITDNLPVLAEALRAGASGQLRNAATIGGNLMQRTRCAYFREPSFPCNKRKPGSGCPAIAGENRGHAIFGWSDACVAVYPSDMAVALAALDANIRIQGPIGERLLAIEDFFLLPGSTPERETLLESDELVIGVEIPASIFARSSTYLKVRDRTSYAFALVSVAAALHRENGVVKEVRLVAGGVAHKPWRLTAAEAALIGSPLEGVSIRAAMNASVEGARPLVHNEVKVDLLRNVVGAVLEQLAKAAQ